MKSVLVTVVMAALSFSGSAQTNVVLPLWSGPAPGSLGEGPTNTPTLTVFLADPAKATGAAMVVCPGGAYQHLARHEGEDYARWLNEAGISAFVLKYRLGPAGYRHPAMLQDAARAMRIVRARAEEWKVDAQRVGIMGSSAGGHLASTMVTHFDAGQPGAGDPIERQSSRPDLGILCYPVISMGPFAHKGSRNNLLGTNPPPELVELLSNEKQVTSNTPPCFVWHTWEDTTVAVENPMLFAEALRRNGVRFELHVYEKGKHGMGLGLKEWKPELWHPWTGECLRWLRERGFARSEGN
jgi:acetyl esterase/lipase